MKRIIESDETFDRFEETNDTAVKRMEESGQRYKVELIKGTGRPDDFLLQAGWLC
jgi:hypothetical protein